MTDAYLQLSGGLRARITLLFFKHVHPLYRRISHNALREIALYLDLSALLPHLQGSHLSLICLETHKESIVQLTQNFPPLSQCCQVSTFNILLFSQLRHEVWEFGLIAHTLTQMPSLSKGRDWPAIVAYRGMVYVFGGYRVTTNERLEAQQWKLLANSQFHHFQTNPCPARDMIYLCDQRTADRGTEVYSIATNEFRQISSPSRFELSSSVSLAVGDALVWLTCLGEVIVQQSEDSGQMVPMRESAFLPTQSCPVRYRNCFYWRQLDGQVRSWKPPKSLSAT